MIWDIAAAIIIAGTALGLVTVGCLAFGEAHRIGDREVAKFGGVTVLIGIGLAMYVVFFRAHFS